MDRILSRLFYAHVHLGDLNYENLLEDFQMAKGVETFTDLPTYKVEDKDGVHIIGLDLLENKIAFVMRLDPTNSWVGSLYFTDGTDLRELSSGEFTTNFIQRVNKILPSTLVEIIDSEALDELHFLPRAEFEELYDELNVNGEFTTRGDFEEDLLRQALASTDWVEGVHYRFVDK